MLPLSRLKVMHLLNCLEIFIRYFVIEVDFDFDFEIAPPHFGTSSRI